MTSKSFSRSATALLATAALILSTSLAPAHAAARKSSGGNSLCYFAMWVITLGTSPDSAGALCN